MSRLGREVKRLRNNGSESRDISLKRLAASHPVWCNVRDVHYTNDNNDINYNNNNNDNNNNDNNDNNNIYE